MTTKVIDVVTGLVSSNEVIIVLRLSENAEYANQWNQ